MLKTDTVAPVHTRSFLASLEKHGGAETRDLPPRSIVGAVEGVAAAEEESRREGM